MHACVCILHGWIYSPPGGMFSLDRNISFSYWSMGPFQATPMPLYATCSLSNHFISKFQNFCKITANGLASCMVSWDSVPRTKSYLSALFTAAHVFSFGVECHAVASTEQWKTAHTRTLLSFFLDGYTMLRKNVHTCQFCQISSPPAAHQLVLYSLEEVENVKTCLWQQCDCPLLPQRMVAFIFSGGWRKVWDAMGNRSWDVSIHC